MDNDTVVIIGIPGSQAWATGEMPEISIATAERYNLPLRRYQGRLVCSPEDARKAGMTLTECFGTLLRAE